MRKPERRPARASLLGVILLSWGCSAGVAPTARNDVRPSDGLLSRPALQAVVGAQARRDGAALVGMLSSPDPAVRARAAFALGSVQDRLAVAALVGALRDVDGGVRRDAAFALGQCPDTTAVAALAEAFTSEADPTVRRRILEALGKIPTAGAARALLSVVIRAGEEGERTLALARLGAVRGVVSADARDHMLARLDDAVPAVRGAAAYYFGRLPDPASWAARAARVREALSGYGRMDLAAMYLVQALGRLGDPADGARVRSWTTGARDWRIRVSGVVALGSLPPDPQNRRVLLDALDDASGQVAWAAAEALARANERDSLFAWLDALPEGDALRRGVGLRALALLPGEEALERLGRATASPDPRIQERAVSALRQRWAEDRRRGGNPAGYFAIFSQVLGGGAAAARSAAARALADSLFAPLGSVSALAGAYALMRAPEDLRAMTSILESLGRSGAPEARAVLEEAALDPEPALRGAAAAALARLGPRPPEPARADTAGGGAERRRRALPDLDWGALAVLGTAPLLRLETERGTVVIRLLPEEAPYTVQAVSRLANEGAYDGVPFHRVVPNFVAQGGDVAARDGSGTPDFALPSEFTQLAFAEGVVGMASAGKDTEGSQFFVTHSRQPHLDGAYTAFGWVVEGMDVVARLMVGDRIVKATVERGG